MKYLRQFAIILGVTCVGELLNYFLPLPIPASIYGLVLMLLLLVTGIVKFSSVEQTGDFLVEIMPTMFIPAGVGLINAWDVLRPILLPITLMTLITTVVVMFVTGKVADALVKDDADLPDPSVEGTDVLDEEQKGVQ